MVAAGFEEVAAEAPNCVSDEICERLRHLPVRWSDRFLLQLIRRFPEEIGFGHAVIVGLDFFRTRPCRLSEVPWAFVNYLKDRWELTSRREVPGRFVEVILWGLQVELGRLSNRLGQSLGSVERNKPRRHHRSRSKRQQ
jgi:hypothetical protein